MNVLPRRRLRKSFTLLELIVVMLIIGILSAIAIPRFYATGENADATAVLSNVKTIHTAVDLFAADNGRLPGDVHRGVFPPDLEGYVHPSVFTTVRSDGAKYDWNGPGGVSSDFGVTLVYPSGTVASSEMYLEIEQLADDGDPSAGWITAVGPRITFHYNP